MDASFFGIGMGELFMIAVVALVVLGPKRLPGVLREIAKTLRYVRNLTNELAAQYGEEFKALDDINPQKLLKELTQELEHDAISAKGSAKLSAAPRPPAKSKPAPSRTASKPPSASTSRPVVQPPPPKTPEATPVAVEIATVGENPI